MGPLASVVNGALKVVQAVEWWPVSRRQAAHRHNAELRVDAVALIGLHNPPVGGLIEGHFCHAGIELNIPA